MGLAVDTAVPDLVRLVEEYAMCRMNDVRRGAETPRLAVTLLRKYGQGVADTASQLAGSPHVADEIWKAVDRDSYAIDPDWRRHQRERWEGRPADLTSSTSPAIAARP